MPKQNREPKAMAPLMDSQATLMDAKTMLRLALRYIETAEPLVQQATSNEDRVSAA